MVCDLSAVLFASFWFADFFRSTDEHTGGVANVDMSEFVRVAFLQSAAFQRFATDILIWFPEGTPLRNTAVACSKRITDACVALNQFVADTVAWSIASKACTGMKVALHPPVPGFIKCSVAVLMKSKEDEERDLFNTLVDKYPYVMHVFFPTMFPGGEQDDDVPQCLECDGVGWFWTPNAGMTVCYSCEGTGHCTCVSAMPSLESGAGFEENVD